MNYRSIGLPFILLLSVCFCLSPTLSFGQLTDVRIETRNDQQFYVHVVQKGNTLWGLHRLYEVSVEEIIQNNPSVQDGLREGDTVYIPVPIIERTKTHTVQGGETWYSIAKQYSTSVQHLQAWNSDVKKDLQIGQILKIVELFYVTGGKAADPLEHKTDDGASQLTITFNDSVVEHRVVRGETLYSISRRYLINQDKILSFNKKRSSHLKPGEVLLIPLKKERIEKVDVRIIPQKETEQIYEPLIFQRKDQYNIAILLPFFLDKTTGYSSSTANMSAEFLMGAQLAIDSLRLLGLNAKVYVFDTENDTQKIASILDRPEFETMDLIIGPLYKENASQLATWCKAHKIRLVCPVNVDTQILQNNPYVYTTIGSDMTLIKGLANYVATMFKPDKVVLIKPDNANDSILYQTFRSQYNRTAGLGGTKIIETSSSNISAYLSYSHRTAIIYPTNDAKSAVTFMDNLSKLSHKIGQSTYVFGTDEWLNMSGLNAFYRNKYRITVPTSLELNYGYDRTKTIHQKYRSRYKSDFTKIAVQGFDVLFHFCSELLLENPAEQLIMNKFEMVQIGPNHGFENQHVEILTHDDYQLKNITSGITP